MQKTQKSRFTARRIALDAVLIALYVVLGFWKIPIGNLLRVNLASFAVVICAVAFSPLDGLVVGFMGEFLSQILGPYGLTPTTLLWVLPEALRGGLLGLFMLLFNRKQLSADRLLRSKGIVLFLAACIFTGLLSSCVNTFALYVDSKMYGYYNAYMVFGVLGIRLGMAAVMSGVFGYVTLHITAAMGRSKII
jgi:ECF transporter S component (folate family)